MLGPASSILDQCHSSSHRRKTIRSSILRSFPCSTFCDEWSVHRCVRFVEDSKSSRPICLRARDVETVESVAPDIQFRSDGGYRERTLLVARGRNETAVRRFTCPTCPP